MDDKAEMGRTPENGTTVYPMPKLTSESCSATPKTYKGKKTGRQTVWNGPKRCMGGGLIRGITVYLD